MQFRKVFNDFLVVQGREIRNMKTNQVKQKHRDDEEDSDKCSKKNIHNYAHRKHRFDHYGKANDERNNSVKYGTKKK